jgi:thiamine-monophosphate kinase
MGEFELIRTFFNTQQQDAEAGVALGIGDDCALLLPTPGQHLAVTTDTLVVGVHFLADDDPASLGHKALAVNLSDLAAMGARPRWVLLNLALPAVDEVWLAAFAQGLLATAQRFDVRLVGGDTVRGELAFGLTAMGEVPPGAALRRAGAKVGDLICVSGVPGEAAAGLAHRLGERLLPEALATQALARLQRPEPRVALGLALRGLASSAVDISDGLAQDLGHILAASGAAGNELGASLELAHFPSSPLMQSLPQALAWQYQLAGGDDYELLFTLPSEYLHIIKALPEEVKVIGYIEVAPGLRILAPDGLPFILERLGHDHFA